MCVFVDCGNSEFWPGSRLCLDLRVLSNGMDPVHLLLAVGSLDEVMSVCLRDDFKQVSLNVAFHTCGQQADSCRQHKPWLPSHLFSFKCEQATLTRCRTGVVLQVRK